MWFVASFLRDLDAGKPLVLLAGIHPGCHELFGTERVRTIRDLRGKTVAVPAVLGTHHLFLAAMASYVGLDVRRDITRVTHSRAEAIRLLAEGQVDAYLAFPPDPQELRARQIGHVVVSSAKDRPWSQYFCCVVGGNRDFVRKHPVATKRAIRALLKASAICAVEPERVARTLVDQGFA
jgi:NitT/TauT family transport system substrate-binding protein